MIGSHEAYLAEALALARRAWELGEVPVGAIVVDDQGLVVGRGHNRSICDRDPTAHAEIVALRDAAQRLGNYRLDRCTLYVTLEPCPMCMGAVFHGRLRALYFGASDPKGGACGSVVALHRLDQFNPHCKVHGGVLERECSLLLRNYFSQLRLKKRLSHHPVREDALRLPKGCLTPWMPSIDPMVLYDLKASRGLALHLWVASKSQRSAGPVVLALSGIGLWSVSFFDLLTAELPRPWSAWCVDLPGQGQSDKTKTGWELDEEFQLSVLQELLSRPEFSSVVLVAQGASSVLALRLAKKMPETVRRVLLIDPTLDPLAAFRSSSNHIPKSFSQLQKWARSVKHRDISPEALQAPYPDAGFAKGLLRWLNNTESGRSSVSLVCAPKVPSSLVSIVRSMSTSQTMLDGFLSFTRLSGAAIWQIEENTAIPWGALIPQGDSVFRVEANQ